MFNANIKVLSSIEFLSRFTRAARTKERRTKKKKRVQKGARSALLSPRAWYENSHFPWLVLPLVCGGPISLCFLAVPNVNPAFMRIAYNSGPQNLNPAAMLISLSLYTSSPINQTL